MKSFRQSGYIMMAIPRSNVMPLDLLYKSGKGTLERYNAPLYELFQGTSPSCPTVDDDDDMPDDISFDEELDLSLKSNIGLLDALTKLIKTKGSLKFSYDEHSNVVMSLKEPKSNKVNGLYLDKFLQSSKLDQSAAGATKQRFEGDLYVITEIIKSKSFTLTNKNATKTSSGIDLTVPNAATAQVSADTSVGHDASVTYQGDDYLTFGVMARRIRYDKPGLFSGKKGIFELIKDDNIVLVRGA